MPSTSFPFLTPDLLRQYGGVGAERIRRSGIGSFRRQLSPAMVAGGNAKGQSVADSVVLVGAATGPPAMMPGGTTGGPEERSGHGDAARAVMRATDRAVLTTAQRDAAGWPYPSLVLVALDHDAAPLLLISTLADHTLNIAADPRVGLLFDGTAGLEQPLAGARLSVLGHALRSEEPRHRQRFLARHPSADVYAGFKDFAVYSVAVERAHLVAGFGRVRWMEGADLLLPSIPPALADQEGAIVRHMNDDHPDALQLYATALLGLPQGDGDGPGWTMTGVDPEGCDLRRGAAVARLPFGRRVSGPEEVRAELVRLVRQARAGGGEGGTSAGHPAA